MIGMFTEMYQAWAADLKDKKSYKPRGNLIGLVFGVFDNR